MTLTRTHHSRVARTGQEPEVYPFIFRFSSLSLICLCYDSLHLPRSLWRSLCVCVLLFFFAVSTQFLPLKGFHNSPSLFPSSVFSARFLSSALSLSLSLSLTLTYAMRDAPVTSSMAPTRMVIRKMGLEWKMTRESLLITMNTNIAMAKLPATAATLCACKRESVCERFKREKENEIEKEHERKQEREGRERNEYKASRWQSCRATAVCACV